MTTSSSVEARARGSLLGLAWGDALGCPVEGWREADIVEVYGRYQDLPEAYPLEKIAPRGPKTLKRLRPLGLHSDDAQQALALLSACMGPNGWSAEVWAETLVAGLRAKAWRGTGRNFNQALANLKKGQSPQTAGSSSAGIGAAMRIGPLGAACRDDPETLALAAMESTMTTHGDIRAGAIAFAVARAVADLVSGRQALEVRESLPNAVAEAEREWLDGRPEWTIDREAGHLISESLAALFDGLDDLALPALRERLSALALPHMAEGFRKGHPNQGFALLGGAHALAMALRSDAEPAETLGEIIRLGYDTDTVAAIAGSLLGARFGEGWIPRGRLLDAENLGAWAQAIADRSEPPETTDALLAREAEWTRREKAFQAELLEAL